MQVKKYIAEFVYGGVDGTITTFAVVSGAMGAALNPVVILILGFANLFADGFSMAVSNYLSNRTRSGKGSISRAVATFASFVAMGLIPILPFLRSERSEHDFALSIVFTAIAFALIGWVKGSVTRTSRSWSMLITVLIGGGAASIAYLVGHLLRGLVSG